MAEASELEAAGDVDDFIGQGIRRVIGGAASRKICKLRDFEICPGNTLYSQCYSIITAKVRRDLLESQKKYTKKKYCKYNNIKNCSKNKHILRRGFERRYYSIPIDV